MALNFPTLKQLIDRSRSDLRELLPRLQPSLVSSFIRAIVDSNSARAFDIVVLLRQVLDQAFPQTAEGEYLGRWAEYDALQQTAALAASGVMVTQGTVGTLIPSGTVWNSVSGQPYLTTADATIVLSSQDLLTAVADALKVVTCTTSTPHLLASGVTADISGLLGSADTIGAVITVISPTEFEFLAPTAVIIGDVWDAGALYSFTGVSVEIEASGTGEATNLSSGDILSIVTPILGVGSNAFVDVNEVLGGVDAETEDELRARVLDRRANPVANFNVAAIERQVRLVPAIDRVFVLPITPYPGAVTIYFFVKDTVSGLPSASQVAAVRESVLEINPATTDPDDVIVSAPDVVYVTHEISSLSPNTPTMQAAITANLIAFYEDQAEMGVPITVNMLQLVIQNSQDTALGGFPESFSLDLPASTVSVTATQIARFGSVSYV